MIVRGPVTGHGFAADYHTLTEGPGEPHMVRTELAAGATSQARTSLLSFVHITDFQLADPISPGRLDFLQGLAGRPGWDAMLPAYRPQEFAALQAFEAMVRTIGELGPRQLDFVITTGDNTDNAQLNELAAFLRLLDGGELDPAFGVADPAGHPSHAVSGEFYNPDPVVVDRYKREYGFPDRPGALEAAARPFVAKGIGVPWLACFGNHDCLAQGRAPVTPEFQALVTGAHRPIEAPPALPHAPYERYLADPTALSGGPALPIQPRADRRVASRAEYIRAHLDSSAAPAGHGFTDRNLADGTAYYCYDEFPGVRVIVLDSTDPAGHVTGSIGARQRDWLITRLAEAHSAHLGERGERVHTGNRDRAVVLASHHALGMLTNTTEGPDADLPRYLAADIEAILHRFPNVVLWIAGHEHRNAVTAHPGPTGGWWHLITSGLCEWPCQARLLELLLPEPGPSGDTLMIRSTMIDHAAPARPTTALDVWDLAAIHRELAANEPTRVGGPHAEGESTDRNVELVVPISPALAANLRAGTSTNC
jgi:metallophosphoesterase (TIGR03767 family)